MKRKIFLTLVLTVLMLAIFMLASCSDEDVTTTINNSTTSSDITTTVPPIETYSTKTDVRRTWEGKTLNIACSTWSGSPGAPWSVTELCVDYGKESGFGTKIDAAVLERQEFIKETYGVELNWIIATRYSMHDALEAAVAAGNVHYDLAMPRAMRAQSIVSGGYVYDLKDREFIDFNNSYYSKNSVEAYTAKGHTFFVDGDFSTLSKETAFVLYFNKAMLGGDEAAANLYKKVREGKWTWSELVTLANVYSDDGDGISTDLDTYGFYTASASRFYEYFGVNQAGVDSATGEWMITLNDPKVDDIISAIITVNTADWCRSILGGSWGGTVHAFSDNRLLFYNETVSLVDQRKMNKNVGVVPFPMLNDEQGRYSVPCSMYHITLMCIPKITQDRAMSEYFLDVLAWTGNEYTTKAYLEQKADQFESDADMEMLTEYIFPNITYDVGAAIGWESLMGDIIVNSYKNNVNSFDTEYAGGEPDVLLIIEDWNAAWGGYTEE